MTPSDSAVIDTHALVWYLENNLRLSPNARLTFDQIDQGAVTGVIPTIVLAELMHISVRGRIPTTFDDIARLIRDSSNFLIAPFDFEVLTHMRGLTALELHDRIIVGTALAIRARLVTRDETVRNANIVDCIW